MPIDQSLQQGLTFLSASKFDRAEACFRELVVREPLRADAWVRLGQVLEKQNK